MIQHGTCTGAVRKSQDHRSRHKSLVNPLHNVGNVKLSTALIRQGTGHLLPVNPRCDAAPYSERWICEFREVLDL